MKLSRDPRLLRQILRSIDVLFIFIEYAEDKKRHESSGEYPRNTSTNVSILLGAEAPRAGRDLLFTAFTLGTVLASSTVIILYIVFAEERENDFVHRI